MSARFVAVPLTCLIVLLACTSDNDGGCLDVTPDDEFAPAGRALTTNFSPDSISYTVENTCDLPVEFAVGEEMRWLDVEIDELGDAETGTLQSDATIEVVIEVRYGDDDPERLNLLAPGSYPAEVRFEDLTNDTTITRSVDLTVNEA